MAKNISGTLRKLVIAGFPFDVIADIDMTEVHSQYKNEPIPTSGENMRKMTKQTTSREGIVIKCNASEAVILKDISESLENVSLAYENAAGDAYKAEGFIDFENKTTADNKASVKMFPRRDWVPFIAP